MTAIYTWDVFTTLDGFGSYNAHGDWGGYWGKLGPEFLDRRVAQYGEELRLVLGANTFRMFQRFLGTLTRDSEAVDPVHTRMKHQPTMVLSSDFTSDWASPSPTMPTSTRRESAGGSSPSQWRPARSSSAARPLTTPATGAATTTACPSSCPPVAPCPNRS